MKISIQSRLRQLNISKAELARKLGVSYPTVLEICNGTAVSIRLDTLEKLCNILSCTPNDIFIYNNQENEPHFDKQKILPLLESDSQFTKIGVSSEEKIKQLIRSGKAEIKLYTIDDEHNIVIPYLYITNKDDTE